MQKNLFKIYLFGFMLVVLATSIIPFYNAQAACSPKAISIEASPTTVTKDKPSTTVKIGLSSLSGCDATTSKGFKVIAKVENLDAKLVDVNLVDFAARFKGKDQYVVEKSVNVLQNATVKDYKSFSLRPGVGAAGKEVMDKTRTVTITNSEGTKEAARLVASNLNASTGEKVDETGESGFVICGNTADTPCNVTHLFRAFIIIINYLITMAGFVAVLFIIIAGVQMITSEGESRLKEAKQRISGAVIGLILVALAFVLVNSVFAGSLNLGIKNGGLILTNPKAYINGPDSGSSTNSTQNTQSKPIQTNTTNVNK